MHQTIDLEKLRGTLTITPIGNENHYVYLNSYPKGVFDDHGNDLKESVFYVGMGTWNATKTAQRIDAHERETLRFLAGRGNPYNPRKIEAIIRIWESQKQVVKQVVFETPSRNKARAMEIALIRQYAGPYLTNIVSTYSTRTIDPTPKQQTPKQNKHEERKPYYICVYSDPRTSIPGLVVKTQNPEKPLTNSKGRLGYSSWLNEIHEAGFDPDIEVLVAENNQHADQIATQIAKDFWNQYLSRRQASLTA